MSSSLFAQHTYYISKSSGSDANTATQAQSKTTPWAHLPQMVSCTSQCASYTPVAGDRFILKGGDTWVASDLGIVWHQSGTASAPIYIGVDQTWFIGGSWTRPILTCGGVACAGTNNAVNYMFIVGSYVTVDNIEFTGLYTTGSASIPSYVSTQVDHDVVENCYFHGWRIASGATADAGILTSFNNNNFAPYSSVGSGLFYSVIDGSDTTQNSMEAVGGAPTYVVGNIIQYVSNGLNNTQTSIVHDNYFGPIVSSFQSTAHQNTVAICCSDNSATTQFIYNNVITGSTCSVCGGVVKLWLDQFGTASTVGFAFNNVIYNNAPGNLINQGHGYAGVNYGVWNFFNNTVECGTDTNTGVCISDAGAQSGSVAVFNSQNNHWISGIGSAVSCTVYNCTSTTDLLQTVGTASSHGYTSGSVPAFQPTGGSTSTIGTGTNLQALCTTIAGLNSDAGAACQSGTGYGCTYNTSNHSVSCPMVTATARPSSGAWNIGAYQQTSSGGCTILPTSLGPYSAGQPVSKQFTTSGCSTSTFAIASGSLSGSGLTLSTGGLLTGTAQAGSYNFTIAYATGTDPISLAINASSGVVNPPTTLTVSAVK